MPLPSRAPIHHRSRFGQRRLGVGKLKEADVILIKRRLSVGEAARKLAAEFGVSEAATSNSHRAAG